MKEPNLVAVSYTHLDVYKRQALPLRMPHLSMGLVFITIPIKLAYQPK